MCEGEAVPAVLAPAAPDAATEGLAGVAACEQAQAARKPEKELGAPGVEDGGHRNRTGWSGDLTDHAPGWIRRLQVWRWLPALEPDWSHYSLPNPEPAP